MWLSIFIALSLVIYSIIFVTLHFYQLKKIQQAKKKSTHHLQQEYDYAAYLAYLGLTQPKNPVLIQNWLAHTQHIIEVKQHHPLTLSFAPQALLQLLQQLNLGFASQQQFLITTQYGTQTFELILADLRHDPDRQLRYFAIHLLLPTLKLSFKQVYICGFSVKNHQIYAYHLRDSWIRHIFSLKHAYLLYVAQQHELLQQGWKNYYYPHEARYALCCATRLVEEQQRVISPEQLSYLQFCQCLAGETRAIYSCYYLQGMVMEILFTADYSQVIEVSKIDHVEFYQKHYLAQQGKSATMMDGDLNSDVFQRYKEQARNVRSLAEQAAVAQGYVIDQSYIDPTV